MAYVFRKHSRLSREHLADDCSPVCVRGQVKGNRVVACLKTDAAWRELISSLLSLLSSESTWAIVPVCYFPPAQGRHGHTRIPTIAACAQSLPASASTYLELGRMASAGFRAAQLKRAGCPGDLRRFWPGHASADISDNYALQLFGRPEPAEGCGPQRGPGI